MTTTTILNNLAKTMTIFNFILSKFRRHLPTKSFCVQDLSAGALATTGDVICQKVVEKRERIDRARTSRFALTTMLLIAPVQYRWFRFLERRFSPPQWPNLQPFGRVRVAFKRVAVDQICLAPLLTASFLFTVNLLESRSPNSALERLKRIYPEVMTNNYKFWPFVQIFNMAFIPLHMRVVFLQFFALLIVLVAAAQHQNHPPLPPFPDQQAPPPPPPPPQQNFDTIIFYIEFERRGDELYQKCESQDCGGNYEISQNEIEMGVDNAYCNQCLRNARIVFPF